MQGRQDKAEPLKKQVMEASKAKLGADYPSTLTRMANLALTLKHKGEMKKLRC
jgi:hypothetical protein